MNMDFERLEPIKHFSFPKTTINLIEPIEDPLVDLVQYSAGKIICDNHYYKEKIPGSINKCLARKGVADLLMKALRMLPDGYTLKVFDAWRPYEVQYHLYYDYFTKLADSGQYDSYSISQLKDIAKEFVSYPQKDADISYVHSSGGAIDLTIVAPDKKALDMGSDFDTFSIESNTDYFEISGVRTEACFNRRLLYHIMTESGFTNLPSEWWHYDYGDVFLAYYTGKPIQYKSLFQADMEVTKNGGIFKKSLHS